MTYSIQVIKVGSSCIVNNGGVNYKPLKKLASEIDKYWDNGIRTVLVSSGAVKLGERLLGYSPNDVHKNEVELKQKRAGVGQIELMEKWRDLMDGYTKAVSQILFEYDHFKDYKKRYNIAKSVLDDIDDRIMPVFNYNDRVDYFEVARDNDKPAAELAILLNQKLTNVSRLIILSDVDGVMDDKNSLIKKATLADIDGILTYCNDENCKGTGGMKVKIEAMKMVMENGIGGYIGHIDRGIERIVNGEGSYFAPVKFSQ